VIPEAIFTVELHVPTAITSKIRRIEDPKEDPNVSNERFMRPAARSDMNSLSPLPFFRFFDSSVGAFFSTA